MNDEREEFIAIIDTISKTVEERGHKFIKPFSVAVIQRSLELYQKYLQLFGISTAEDIALYEEIF